MLPSQIVDLTSHRPFKPIRIKLSGGRVFDIHHPNMIWVTKSAVMVSHELDEAGLPDMAVYIDPRHIETIEFISGNGSNGS